jgi:hypothetical protein
MSRFINLPHLVPYGDGINWCLLNDFQFEHKDGIIITAPVKFITDFASIPRIFWEVLGPPWGKHGFGAITHDYLYYSQTTTKDYADEVLMEAMIVAGVSIIDRSLIFEGVHKAGQTAWDENKRKKNLGFIRIAQDFPVSINDRPFYWTGTTGDWKKG